MNLLPSLLSPLSPQRRRASFDVWADMNELMRQMSQGFPDLNGDSYAGFPIDIEETETEYIVEADLPKVAREDIEILLKDRILTIQVRKTKEKEEKKKNYICKERACACASRSVSLPFADEAKDVAAVLKDGVLTVRVARASDKQGQKIKVQ